MTVIELLFHWPKGRFRRHQLTDVLKLALVRMIRVTVLEIHQVAALKKRLTNFLSQRIDQPFLFLGECNDLR